MSFIPACLALADVNVPMFKKMLDAVPFSFNPIQSILVAYVIAVCVPQVLRAGLTAAHPAEKGGYDNCNPRVQVDRLSKTSPMIARLQACHMNGYESLHLWCAGVILGVVTGLDQDFMSKVASLFILSRFLFLVLYIVGSFSVAGAARSFAWVVSTYCSALLIAMAATKHGEVFMKTA